MLREQVRPVCGAIRCVPPMTATMVLMATVEPSAALISVSTPAAGDGISASTLSVEISKSGSSRWTVSPTFLSHLVMVPSVMDSPICGIGTSVPGRPQGQRRRCGSSLGLGCFGSAVRLRQTGARQRSRAASPLQDGDDGVDGDGRALLRP